jgi:hypothetical protein
MTTFVGDCCCLCITHPLSSFTDVSQFIFFYMVSFQFQFFKLQFLFSAHVGFYKEREEEREKGYQLIGRLSDDDLYVLG